MTNLNQNETHTIKPMYRFFDRLFGTLNHIGQDNITEWSHKETPVLVYAILTHEEARIQTIDANDASYIAKTLEEAQEELSYY